MFCAYGICFLHMNMFSSYEYVFLYEYVMYILNMFSSYEYVFLYEYVMCILNMFSSYEYVMGYGICFVHMEYVL